MSTQALLASQYEFSGEPDGHPNTRPGVTLHYVRKCMEPIIQARLDRVVEHFGLTADSHVLIVGAGYGWGVEYLARICTCVGTESDSYFHITGAGTDYAEIQTQIEAVGLSVAEGRGLELLQRWYTPSPKMQALVCEQDSLSQASRDAVVAALGQAPDLVILEDMITGLSLEDAEALMAAVENYGAPVCCVGLFSAEFSAVASNVTHI